jgi:hypothetical protein
MILLEFTHASFSRYEFGAEVFGKLELLEKKPVDGFHLHIALMETQYLVYDNDSRCVLDMGSIEKENWMQLLPGIFQDGNETVFVSDESYKPLVIYTRVIDVLTGSLDRREIPDAINAINATIAEANRAFSNIKYCTQEFPKVVTDAIHMESRLVQHIVQSSEYYDDWYLSWCLEYESSGKWMNLLDIRFTDDSVRGWPRIRIRHKSAPNKKILIEDYLGGQDVYYRGIAGLEYRF